MRNLLYSISILFVLAGCKVNTPMTGSPRKIVDLPESIQTSFYDNVSEYGILQLETSEESLLSNIIKIRVYGDRIFILSGLSNSKLLSFDRNGKFVSEIGRRGRGPKEYTELYNFEIDPSRDELLLLDKAGRKILIYKLNGDFEQEVKISSSPECAGRLPNGNFILSHAGSQLKFNDYHVIAIYDENGKLLNRQIENQINTSTYFATKNMMTAMHDGSLSLMPQYHNVVYHITNDGIIAEIGFNIPGETITIDNFDQEFNSIGAFMGALKGKNYVTGDHAETNEYIFFYNKRFMETEHIFYNKTNRKSLRVTNPLLGTSVFMDKEGYCWGAVDETILNFSEKKDDELTRIFLESFKKYDNVPLIYYKIKDIK